MTRLRGLIRPAAALLLLAAAAPGLAGPAPSTLVRIDTVSFAARNPLGPGARLPVSLRGTGGGAATFHLFGVASDIGMRELRAAGYQGLMAQYTGTYVVRPGDAVRNGALFATLSGRGADAIAAGPRGITIDGRLPRVVRRLPAPGARLANTRPNIAIDIVDLESGVDPASVRLIVNGQDVTARASVSETSVRYNPAEPFRPGPVRVQLTVADRAGNAERWAWEFAVLPPSGLISSVTVNPAGALTDNDLLTVVVAGVSGGRASFTIEGIRGSRPLQESRTKGIYFGSIVVLGQDALAGGTLVATLEKDGRRSALAATVPLTILAGLQPPAPTVTTSSRTLLLEDPAARLDLSGRARPGHRIVGRIAYSVRSPSATDEGTLGEFTALAASDGSWRISLGPLVPLPDARLVVTVVAIDQAGRRSPPATLELTSS